MKVLACVRGLSWHLVCFLDSYKKQFTTHFTGWGCPGVWQRPGGLTDRASYDYTMCEAAWCGCQSVIGISGLSMLVCSLCWTYSL